MSVVTDPGMFSQELMVRLQTAHGLQPKALAELFHIAVGTDPMQVATLNTLQKFLLDKTIAHACSTTAFYRHRLEYSQWRPTSDHLPADLSSLPVLTRADVVEAHKQFIANDVRLHSISHTSGSTGMPLDVYRSHEEVEFVFSYFSNMFKDLCSGLRERPLVLSFPNSYHGVPLPMPGVGMTFVSGVTDDTLINDALRVLQTEYDIPGYSKRISILSGLYHHVLLFTSYLLQQGIDPREFQLSGVNVTGGHCCIQELGFLQSAWNTMVYDRFTLTEAVGGASRCFKCNQFHLDQQIFGEVVDFDTLAPVTEGIGLLLLTTLYPFVQMQPMIRYSPGDLVRRAQNECPGAVTFEFLGKSKNCISLVESGRREWLIFSAPLNDVLSTCPDVNAYDWFANLRSVQDRTIGSLPRAAITTQEQGGRLAVHLKIELRYSPYRYADRIRELSHLVTSYLFAVPSTSLQRRVEEGRVDFQVSFLGPGALKDPVMIKV